MRVGAIANLPHCWFLIGTSPHTKCDYIPSRKLLIGELLNMVPTLVAAKMVFQQSFIALYTAYRLISLYSHTVKVKLYEKIQFLWPSSWEVSTKSSIESDATKSCQSSLHKAGQNSSGGKIVISRTQEKNRLQEGHLEDYSSLNEWVRESTRRIMNSFRMETVIGFCTRLFLGLIQSGFRDASEAEHFENKSESMPPSQERERGLILQTSFTNTLDNSDPIANNKVDLAFNSVKAMCNIIETKLEAVKHKVGAVAAEKSFKSELEDIKSQCEIKEGWIHSELNDAFAELEKHNSCLEMSETIVNYFDVKNRYLDSLEVVKDKVVKAESSSICSSDTISKNLHTDPDQSLAPYIQRLQPPVFSGNMEDWSQFRFEWENLFTNVPDIIQLQYLKSCIPSSDARRVKGIRTMKEFWEKFNCVYGTKEFNVLIVKSKLESLVPKSYEDHELIIEVYEEVEFAVTQLRNVGALSRLSNDFILINRLVAKLSFSDQKHYTEFVTTSLNETETSSKWDIFWIWFEMKYKAALQMRLIKMCTNKEKLHSSYTHRKSRSSQRVLSQKAKRVSISGASNKANHVI